MRRALNRASTVLNLLLLFATLPLARWCPGWWTRTYESARSVAWDGETDG